MRKFILFLFSISLSFSIVAQSTEKLMSDVHRNRISNPDSAIIYGEQLLKKLSKNPNAYYSARCYNAMSISHYMRGELDLADSMITISYKYGIKSKDDTLQIYILNNRSLYKQDQGEIESAFNDYFTALKIAKQKNLYTDIAETYNNISTLHLAVGATDSAEQNLLKGLDYNKKEKIKIGTKLLTEAALQTNLGQVYYFEGKFNLANKAFFKSLKQYEKLKEWEKAAIIASNISELYYEKEDYKKSLYYSFYSMRFDKKLAIPVNKPTSLLILGKNHGALGNPDSAEYYLLESEKAMRESENYLKLPVVLNSIASFYIDYGDHENAKPYLDSSLFYNSKFNNLGSMEITYELFSQYYLKRKDLVNSKKYIDLARSISNPEENLNYYVKTHLHSAEIYGEMGNYKEAYQFMKIHQMYLDTLISMQNNREQEETEAIYQTEKKQKEIDRQKAINEKESLKLKHSEEQSNAKTWQLRIAMAAGVLLMVLVVFVIRTNLQRKKINQILSQKNEIIYKQKEEVELKSKELVLKNHLIEEKQKEITDSINYAKRIQFSLLAQEEIVSKHLPDHFILFKPKDIVSGDFYWATEKSSSSSGNSSSSSNNEKVGTFYLAVCDCTGHGVPGAFMSLLNISFLNEAINEKNISDPAKVLNFVRERLIKNMDGSKDGMDAILLKFEIRNSKSEISYAAAHNKPVLIRKGEMQELKADKMPVGLGERKNDFEKFEIETQKNDMIYLYTDGYADQFGGPKSKKLKSSNLNKLLVEISSKPVTEQKEILHREFESWKGELEQIDDVCIIGVRI